MPSRGIPSTTDRPLLRKSPVIGLIGNSLDRSSSDDSKEAVDHTVFEAVFHSHGEEERSMRVRRFRPFNCISPLVERMAICPVEDSGGTGWKGVSLRAFAPHLLGMTTGSSTDAEKGPASSTKRVWLFNRTTAVVRPSFRISPQILNQSNLFWSRGKAKTEVWSGSCEP